MADIMSQLVLQSTTAGAAKYQSWCCKVPKLVLQSTKVGAAKYQSWCCKVPKLVLESTGQASSSDGNFVVFVVTLITVRTLSGMARAVPSTTCVP